MDSVEKIRLGGVEQTVLIQAENPTKPVLLFIHGGPCMPVPGVVSRGQDYAVSTTTKELVKHFVVVFYDQRGAGKSFNKNTPAESMRVEQYITDCNELVDVLRSRFNQEKIYLAAHSWGSIIGLNMTLRYPEKLHGYIGISQILNWTDNDKLCYDWVVNKAKQANDQKTLKKLYELGQPPYLNVKQWTEFRRPLIKYNSMVYKSETVQHPGMIGGLKQFFTSSEYSLMDIFHSFYSAYNLTYTQELIEDFAKINLNQLKKVETRIAFLHGTKDVHVEGKPVETFFNNLEAPLGKEIVWYENSSHMFHPDDARMIEKYIIDFAHA
ncbi:alpha/beta hydrolase [Bacillus sp. SLBN-46]|uniref:alpha/beta hydrolase n=1 Tax=Bacillus sp. SLBN-46 TaxID=3042283 RepID=UPI00286BB8DF|nr:alpha/beta hydrolase [Bacillus sp. SLBN-46]